MFLKDVTYTEGSAVFVLTVKGNQTHTLGFKYTRMLTHEHVHGPPPPPPAAPDAFGLPPVRCQAA